MKKEFGTPEVETDIARSKLGLDQGEGAKAGGGSYLSILLPVDLPVWEEARRLVGDKNVRVEDLATCASQDPVLVIELLKTANAMYFSGGRPPITQVKTAIIRLGSEVVLELMDSIVKRPQLESEDVNHWFEIHRSRCRRTSIVARILSEALSKTLSDDCQAIGLLTSVGEMIAVAFFQDKYVGLAEELARTGINYRLAQDYKFDMEKVNLSYLRRHGIPEALLFAVDRDAKLRSPERAIMKPLVAAAMEMVDAFDLNRWEKLGPGKVLPSKSNIRLLQISDSQYLKIYERASEFLYSIRMAEERKRAEAHISSSAKSAQEDFPEPNSSSPAESEPDLLQMEIEALLNGLDVEEPQRSAPQETKIIAPKISTEEEFSLKPPSASKSRKSKKISFSSPKVEAPQLTSQKGTKVVTEIAAMFDGAQSSEELLSQLLAMLTDQGLFKKSALIVVSKDKKSALVVAARGPKIGTGQRLSIDDPLSPLAECFSKVQSFGTQKSKNSPFGSKAYALAPIEADHETPVALYADCGDEGSVPFEARRVFRTVVEILNKKLPELPGGIPVELENTQK